MAFPVDLDPVSHLVNAQDVIIAINAAWARAAVRDGCPDLPARVLNTLLYDHLTGETTQHLYHDLTEKVRAEQVMIRFPFRCDTPDQRRWHEMEMIPGRDGLIEFRCTMTRVEPRERVRVLDAEVDRIDDVTLKMCFLCKRIEIGQGRWLEAEDALRYLGIFASEPVPGLEYGVCPDDADLIREILKGS